MVAYKGGHVQKDLLNKLNISCLDLETKGYPKCEQLKQTIIELLATCGFHLNDNIHHYPMIRVSHVLVMVSNLSHVNNLFYFL